jgi:AAA domain
VTVVAADPELARRKGELDFRSFSDLATLPPEPDWLWRGLIAEGALTMLVGRSFIGKTMLVGGLLRAMEAGDPFLGRETRTATAVLIREEHAVTLRPRAEALGLNELKSEFASRSDGVFQTSWTSLIEQATEHALKRGHRLLVIDTFTGLAQLKAEEENDAGAITERLQPLVVATGEGLGVLLLHHTNKNGQSRGSSAFGGVADAAIVMRRETQANVFGLLSESRFGSVKLRGKLTTSASGMEYVALEDPPKGRVRTPSESADALLLKALAEAGSGGLTYKELGSFPGLTEDVARKRLPRMLGTKVSRTRDGKKGDPFRYLSLSA